MTDSPSSPSIRIGRRGGFVLVVVVVLLCTGLYWVPVNGGLSGMRARVAGESGSLVVEGCLEGRAGGQRATWACAGVFTPGSGPSRDVWFDSTSDVPAGERLTADAPSGSSDEVYVRRSPAGVLLVCPLALLAMLIVAAARYLLDRRPT